MLLLHSNRYGRTVPVEWYKYPVPVTRSLLAQAGTAASAGGSGGGREVPGLTARAPEEAPAEGGVYRYNLP
ncbi:hypothetical protein GCM10019016_068990 [Streptomyces prasinosporus]|uniref:Uncharacterized protein n=1 Tax=Streptomyces prasinosporus TaxID=68256 RepID=A0ABP6TWU6_9ACTN|nr:hypothetical protein GCM10010332_31910 [Streptomyces albogriseolus]